MTAVAEQVEVEVVFVAPGAQSLLTVQIEPGTSVAQAIAGSGIAARHPDFDFDALAVGVWGRIVDRSTTLSAGDRVEIYRELCIDPREARRQLALSGRTMRDGDEPTPD